MAVGDYVEAPESCSLSTDLQTGAACSETDTYFGSAELYFKSWQVGHVE